MDEVVGSATELDGWGEPEANTEDGLIPNSYLEDGIRHAVIWETGECIRLTKEADQWVLVERCPF